MEDEDWVQAAMADDILVAELLVTLRNAVVHPIHSENHGCLPPSTLPSDWRVRHPRSKPTTDSKKKSTSTISPSTPLSWSGGTPNAATAAADGFEESSRPPDSARSKVSIGTKRARKKKSIAELKEEEEFLISERRHLTKELVAAHMNLENQRATNQSLKRLKVDTEGKGDTGHGGRFLVPDLNLPYEDSSM